jgi:hypothetical protein
MPEFTLPEFTRSLRALAVPSQPGSDHDLVWAPFVQALTMAHKAQSMGAQLAAFEPMRIERALRAAIATMGERRHAKSPPDRRALEAELEMLGDALWRALVRVGECAERDALVLMFRAADDWWADCLPALADSRGRRGALWRRVLSGGAR